MSAFLVWLDPDLAKVFDIEPGNPDPSRMKRHLVVHHTGLDENAARSGVLFFERVARNLRGANEILVVGPGLRKEKFIRYLQAYEANLALALVGVKESSELTDQEVMELSAMFFTPANKRSRSMVNS